MCLKNNEDFKEHKEFLEWPKSSCGGCRAKYKSGLLTCARCKVILKKKHQE